MNYQATLDRSFEALSHPARRAIVSRLAGGQATIGEASRGLGISKPAVTKHVKVLEAAGIVSRSVRGRRHLLELEPSPLHEASSWLELHRSLWEAKFEVIERHLAESREGKENP